MSNRLRWLPWWLGWALAVPFLSAATPLPPNPRGEVMILVYHNFAARDASWTRAFSSFDSDLARLEADGYRPITLRQYATGDFVLPPGTSPVVLTFDDSSTFQVKFTPDGQVSPDCALAHWMDFAKTHPDFPVHGVWFVNLGAQAFSQHQFVEKKLQLLVQLGSEIGNHTYTHPNLGKSSPALQAKEIALGQAAIDRYLPGYDVVSFALPFGVASKPEDLAFAGQWSGPVRAGQPPTTVKWTYQSVVRVGAGPAPSPWVAGWDGHRLPRIQADPIQFDKWVGFFEKHPERRLVSDGHRHAPGSLPAPAAPARARGNR